MKPTFPVDDETGCRAGSSLLPVLLVLLLSVCRGNGQTALKSHFLISGVVVSAADGSPLPRCRMTATPSGPSRRNGSQPAVTESDDRGRFSLEVASAGNWQLNAMGRNVHSQPYEGHDGFFTGIVLTDAEPVYRVVFRAVLDAVVQGLVVDEAGEAVRNAPIFLVSADPNAGADTGLGRNARAQQTTTDDRGRYEFAGLEAGAYLMNVRARPWYALQTGYSPANASGVAPDPSLDLVYPITWHPGTTDATSAAPLSVRAGEHAQADFHLQPIASARLVFPAAATQSPGTERSDGGPPRGLAQVSLLVPHGGLQPVFGNYSTSPAGELEVGGLAPGTYQVTYPASGPDAPGRTSIVTIGAGGTITEAGAGSGEASLTISVAGDGVLDAGLVTLVETATQRTIRLGGRGGRPGGPNGGSFQRPGSRRTDQAAPGSPGMQRPAGGLTVVPVPAASGSGAEALRPIAQSAQTRQEAGPAVTVDLPPGRYEVSVPENSGAFVTGLSVSGNQAGVEGRFLTMREENANLVVHVASGLAGVEGKAAFQGKPAVGALVLLVPATMGAPTSLATVHRDQSNTDGGFRMTGVIPGQYILVAIEHGWNVRWWDPATLRPYLLYGSPLEVAASATAKVSLQATTP